MSRRAIVTGGGSGIGQATALRLAADGFDVAVTYSTNHDGATSSVKQIRALGRSGWLAELDLADPTNVESELPALIDAMGGVEVLVNNAGVNPRATTLEASTEEWNRTLAVDLVSPWACARAAARDMIRRGAGGVLVNITSILATQPLASGGQYCAAKAGLDMLTKVMALELAPHGIRVNAVAPGHTATPMNYPAGELEHAANVNKPVIPLGRAATAEEIAAVVSFLAGPASSYLTGASLLTDGGLALASGPEHFQHVTGLPPSSRSTS